MRGWGGDDGRERFMIGKVVWLSALRGIARDGQCLSVVGLCNGNFKLLQNLYFCASLQLCRGGAPGAQLKLSTHSILLRIQGSYGSWNVSPLNSQF